MNMLVLGILYLALVIFAVRIWWPEGKLAIRDRWALITGFATALAAFALSYTLVDWVAVSSAVWLAPVLLLGAAVFGAVLRWTDIVWLAGARSVGRLLRVTTTLSISALVILTALVSATA